MTTIDLAAQPLIGRQTIQLRLKGVRVLSLRARLAAAIVRIAGVVAPCGFDIVEEQPKARFHDVAVEKVGSDMRLVIGDRAVRLERRDADHLGELLTARWAGGVLRVRADDPSA